MAEWSGCGWAEGKWHGEMEMVLGWVNVREGMEREGGIGWWVRSDYS